MGRTGDRAGGGLRVTLQKPACARVWLALVILSGLALPGRGSDEPGPSRSPAPGAGPIANAFPLRFDSEIIRLSIVGDSLEIDGTYFLACQRASPEPVALFYPFPRDSLLAEARMLDGQARVGDGPWEPLRFETIPKRTGVRWWAPSCSGDTIEMRGRYRQGLRGNYARYIVTSTRAWHQPLRNARFEIRLPEGAKPIEFSYPFEAARDSLGIVYVWEAAEFYPDRDITVRWE